MPDGNVQGYAQARNVASNPLAGLPEKILFHELGHILLGHTKAEAMADTPTISRNQREMEAESVAMICIESLGLPGAEFCRGYIQNWYGTWYSIPEANARGASSKRQTASSRRALFHNGVPHAGTNR